MKNEEKILNERIRLAKEELIGVRDSKVPYRLPSGTWIEIPEPEEIHTKGFWAKKNFKVKEGEEPITKIKIWKNYQKTGCSKLVYKETAFYAEHQVEEKEKKHE